MQRQARLLKKLGDVAAERAALQQLVAAYQALDTRQRSRPRHMTTVASARKRLRQLGK